MLERVNDPRKRSTVGVPPVWGVQAGFTEDQVTDLIIAVSEVAGNAVAHTGNGGSMLCWREDQSLVCEMRDGGHIQDLLAGRVPPRSRPSPGAACSW